MPDAAPMQAVCAGAALADGGRGVRFPLVTAWGTATGFVVRYRGVAHGWLNECAHVPVELDWVDGVFFDESGLYLMCATHGAVYEPDTGRCAGGPCRGGKLRQIRIVEQDGTIYWCPDAVFGTVIPVLPQDPASHG